MIYIITAGIAGYIEYISQCRFRDNSRFRILGLLLIVLMLGVIAGVRSIHVGTDTLFYAERSFSAAESTSLSHFYRYSDFSSWEPLSKLLFWTTAHFSHSFSFMLFSISIAAFLPALFGMRVILGHNSSIGMALYVLMVYPLSFNLMRQVIAMGILVLAAGYLLRYKLIPFLALVCISVLFHKPAIVSLLMIPLFFYSKGSQTIDLKIKTIFLLFVIFTVGFVFCGEQIASLFGYGAYFSGSADKPGGGETTLLAFAGIMVLECLMYLQFMRHDIDDSELHGDCADASHSLTRTVRHFSYILTFVGVLAFSYCLLNFWFHRIGFYFLQFFPCSVISAATSINQTHYRRKFLMLSIALMLVLFWFYYVYQGANEVVPYIFAGWK